MKPQVTRRIPEADKFLSYCRVDQFKPRAAIFRQEDPSDCLYLVL